MVGNPVQKHRRDDGHNGIYSRLGLSTSNNDCLYAALNNGGTANSVATVWRDHASTIQTVINTIAASSDGNWHVLAFGHLSGNGYQYWDGVLQANAAATNPGAWTLDRATIGCLRRTTNTNGCSSGVTIGALLFGAGDTTTIADLHSTIWAASRDLLDGQFGGTRSTVGSPLIPIICGGD